MGRRFALALGAEDADALALGWSGSRGASGARTGAVVVVDGGAVTAAVVCAPDDVVVGARVATNTATHATLATAASTASTNAVVRRCFFPCPPDQLSIVSAKPVCPDDALGDDLGAICGVDGEGCVDGG